MPPASQPPHSKPLEQPELAEAPFDHGQADLILQSSDEVHFRVFKNILSLASPIFADMFRIPSPAPPSETPHNEVQVVPLSEHSTALDIALRHIYPVQRMPNVDTLRCANILAEFSRKYQVEALYRFIIGYLKDGIKDDPVGVYAIAITYGYGGIGEDAARLCLDLPFFTLESPYLQYATADHISELFKYHVACGQAASAVASSDRSCFSSLAQARPGILSLVTECAGDCQSCFVVNQTSTGLANEYPATWCMWNYLYRSALVLAHHPTPEAVTTEAFVQTNNCLVCASDLRVYMIELSVAFGRQIKKAIAQVPLPKAVSVESGSTTDWSIDSAPDSSFDE